MRGLNSPRSELELAEAELQAREKEVQARRETRALRQSRKLRPKSKDGEDAAALPERFREIKQHLEAQLETRRQQEQQLEEALARLPTPPGPIDHKDSQAKEVRPSSSSSSIWQSRIATLQEELKQKSEKVSALRLREQQLEAELRNRLHADAELLPGLRAAAAELRSAVQRLPQAAGAALAQQYDSARSRSGSGSPPKSCVLARVVGETQISPRRQMSPRRQLQDSFASAVGEAPQKAHLVATAGIGPASRQPRISACKNNSFDVNSPPNAGAHINSNFNSCVVSGHVFPQPRECGLSMPSSWQPSPRGTGSATIAAGSTNAEREQFAPTLLSIGKHTETKGGGHAGWNSGGPGPWLHSAQGRSMTPPARSGPPVAAAANVPRHHGLDTASHAFSQHAAALAGEHMKVQPGSGAGPWAWSASNRGPGPMPLGGFAPFRNGEPAQGIATQAQVPAPSFLRGPPQIMPRQINFDVARRALTPPPMSLVRRSMTPPMGSLVAPSVPSGYVVPVVVRGGVR